MNNILGTILIQQNNTYFNKITTPPYKKLRDKDIKNLHKCLIKNKNIKTLNIQIDDNCYGYYLKKILEDCTNIENICIHGNIDNIIPYFREGLMNNKSLRKLTLYHILTKSAIKYLCEGLKISSLQKLKLTIEYDTKELANYFEHTKSLKELDLCYKSLSTVQNGNIYNGLKKNKSITKLRLVNVMHDANEIKKLLKANTIIEKLFIHGYISHSSSIIKGLKNNKTLKKLHLGNINREEINIAAKGLEQNETLEKVYITTRFASTYYDKRFLRAINQHKSLKCVRLWGIKIDEKNINEILNIIRNNKLIEFDLQHAIIIPTIRKKIMNVYKNTNWKTRYIGKIGLGMKKIMLRNYNNKRRLLPLMIQCGNRLKNKYIKDIKSKISKCIYKDCFYSKRELIKLIKQI